MPRALWLGLACSIAVVSAPQIVRADSADLAQTLQNPVANLISFPIQSNYDFNVGPEDGIRSTTNVQPVIPVSISEDWNLISRTIVPIVYQNDVVPGEGAQFGLSDTLQSVFFSPKAPIESPIGNVIWGAGPAIALPTSTDRLLGPGTFGLGPTGVVLAQQGPWTYGTLLNHVWGVAETRDDVPDVNNTFIQPFAAYTTSSAWTFSINTELNYNWTAEELSGPINFAVSKVVTVAEQPISLQGRLRWWAADTASSPEGLGFTLNATFLFPTGG
ncbi:MAG: hypothetical protein AAFP17_09345 [Pseudomonadota bacterium]